MATKANSKGSKSSGNSSSLSIKEWQEYFEETKKELQENVDVLNEKLTFYRKMIEN